MRSNIATLANIQLLMINEANRTLLKRIWCLVERTKNKTVHCSVDVGHNSSLIENSNEALQSGRTISVPSCAIFNRFRFVPLQPLNLAPCAIQIIIAKCGTTTRIATS